MRILLVLYKPRRKQISSFIWQRDKTLDTSWRDTGELERRCYMKLFTQDRKEAQVWGVPAKVSDPLWLGTSVALESHEWGTWELHESR